LNKINILTIKDLVSADTYQLKKVLGINGERLQNRAKGIDPSPVDPDAVHEFKSIGSSETLPQDTTDELEIKKLFRQLARNVERRLKRKQAVGRSVQIMIRYQDRKTVTRSMKIPEYIESEEAIMSVSLDLFERNWNQQPIRLLGITIQDVAEKQDVAQQLDLFTYEKEAGRENLYKAIEDLTEKYGKNPFLTPKDKQKNDQPRTSFQKDFLDDFKK
jgi:DNA polymerase-4